MIANSPSDQRQKWSYPPIEGHFDEMLAADGATRPHWQGLMARLTELGAEEIDRRWARARKAIEENGVTYTVYGEEAGDRDWQLDTLPLVISADEWKLIEQAVIQRASLLNRVLGDVYGKQELLISGLLPGAAVFIQQSFLRPMIGLPIPGGIFNHIHAFDLARGQTASGGWLATGRKRQRDGICPGEPLDFGADPAGTVSRLQRHPPRGILRQSQRHHPVPCAGPSGKSAGRAADARTI